MDYYQGRDDWKHNRGTVRYQEHQELDAQKLSNFEIAIDIHHPRNEYDKKYSVMMGEFIPYVSGVHIGKNTYAIKSFKVPLPSTKGDGAFEVQGAMCNRNGSNSGLISVGIKRGLEATYPLHYELKKATMKNGIVTPVGEAIETVKITEDKGADASLRVFSGLAEGWYQVTAEYNFGGGCPAQAVSYTHLTLPTICSV